MDWTVSALSHWRFARVIVSYLCGFRFSGQIIFHVICQSICPLEGGRADDLKKHL
jgi:hypothetical protein